MDLKNSKGKKVEVLIHFTHLFKLLGNLCKNSNGLYDFYFKKGKM